MASSSSSSSSCNWVYDVFPSFRGKDVRITFLSHFLKELDRKLIIAFKDSEIKKGQSLDPELKQAIRTSRIAVVVLSEKYPSSSWCLDELTEIVKCRKESGQLVIPIFYDLDPSHVRYQTEKFGNAFAKTCERKTEDEKELWRQSLIEVANMIGYHSHQWSNEAKMIEAIVNDVLSRLNITQPKDFENFVGMEDHIAEMSVLLDLESKEVRMVGIWGTSGIGKTSIARALECRISHHFQATVFIDRAFVSTSTTIYTNANPYDMNMRLHLVRRFLSKFLDNKDIKIDCLSAMEDRLKNKKVLIFIDDLDDQMVLDTLVGKTHWFGSGSRIIVVTKDKHFLRAHEIDYIFEVSLPSKHLALEMLSISAFKKRTPPEDMRELASEVAFLAGNLPLGLTLLGASLRNRDKEYWMNMLPRFQNSLDGKIEKTLRVSYDVLDNTKDQALFRLIACLFNGEELDSIKRILASSDLEVNIGLENLVEKALIHVRNGVVQMHRLLEVMGKEIVRAQSKEPGEREFLIDSKDICKLFNYNTGTKTVLGISLNMDEIDELHIHENVFKEMPNLFFLNIFNKNKQVRWHLPEGFDYLPTKLRVLRLDGYPMKCMPSNFRSENLVKLYMQDSKLEKLWDGVQILKGLEEINLKGSKNLKEIPDLSMATNLERLYLNDCSSLVELPSSIKYLNKLERLSMSRCTNLETLPTRINLRSLKLLDLNECSKLKNFPDISTNIYLLYLNDTCIEEFPSDLYLENIHALLMSRMESEKLWERRQPLEHLRTILSPALETLILSDIPSLVEFPSFLMDFPYLLELEITNCINLETLPDGFDFQRLVTLELSGCPRLKTFPDISGTGIATLCLDETGIEEVPRWIENCYILNLLTMRNCNSLVRVSLNIYQLELEVDFSDCKALIEGSWNDSQCELAMAIEGLCEVYGVRLPCKFFNLDAEAILNNRSIIFPSMELSSEELPSYFIHRTTENSLTNIPLHQTSLAQRFLRLRVGALVYDGLGRVNIDVKCRFKSKCGNTFDYQSETCCFGWCLDSKNLCVLDCYIPLIEDDAPLPQLSYNLVDIEINISGSPMRGYGILGEWGVRFCEDFSLEEEGLLNPSSLPLVCETDEASTSYMVNKRPRESGSESEYEAQYPPILYTYKRKRKKITKDKNDEQGT